MRVKMYNKTAKPEHLVELEMIPHLANGVAIIDRLALSGPNILYIDEKGVHMCMGYRGALPVNDNHHVLVQSIT